MLPVSASKPSRPKPETTAIWGVGSLFATSAPLLGCPVVLMPARRAAQSPLATAMASPVMLAAPCVHRNSTAFATSSGVTPRLMGWAAMESA